MYAQTTLSRRADARGAPAVPARSPNASSDAKGDLQHLFKSYDAACLDFDADAVAGFYDLPCLIASPTGTVSFNARGELRAAFARVFSGYRQQGLVSASLVSLKIESLSAGLAQARAIWSLANGRGTEVASLGCHYALRRSDGSSTGGKWRISYAAMLEDMERPTRERLPTLHLPAFS